MKMNQPGHCLCEEHKQAYKPQNIKPAWFIAPEHLRTVFFCGRCGNVGKKVQGGLVFGEKTLHNGMVQFANHACYWLNSEELGWKVPLRDAHGHAAK